MNNKQLNKTPLASPANLRWLLIAVASMGIHQVQSMIQEPGERTFRIIFLTLIGLLPLTKLLPARLRGVLWMLIGAPPTFGAFVGHLIPIVRNRQVPTASETAPLNLAGGAFLVTLGASLAFSPTPPDEQ